MDINNILTNDKDLHDAFCMRINAAKIAVMLGKTDRAIDILNNGVNAPEYTLAMSMYMIMLREWTKDMIK